MLKSHDRRIEQDEALHTPLSNVNIWYADGTHCPVLSAANTRRRTSQVRDCRAGFVEGLMERAGQENTPGTVGGKLEVLAETEAKLESTVECQSGRHAADGYFTAEQRDSSCLSVSATAGKIVTVAMGSPKQGNFIKRLP